MPPQKRGGAANGPAKAVAAGSGARLAEAGAPAASAASEAPEAGAQGLAWAEAVAAEPTRKRRQLGRRASDEQ
eukprot:2065709-Lingulodinium_polyedra.AAC.1